MNDTVRTTCLVLALFAGATGAARADSAWVTEADVLDAILERRAFTPQERAEIDLNGDGGVDVADLVCLRFQCHREASFAAADTTVDEGAGTVPVTIQLETAYSGILNYAIAGTATPGADYTPLTGSVEVDGTTATIPVSVLDDDELAEPGETIVLTLTRQSGYGLGAIAEHTLLIVDNDARWHGTLMTTGGVVRFQLEMTHTATGYVAQLIGDPHGGFPEGAWPATVEFDVAGGSFELTVPPIALDAGATSFAAPLTRGLELNPADLGTDPTAIQVTGGYVFGEFRETLASPSRPELTRIETGPFSLARVETSGTDATAPLSPAGQGE